MKAKSRSLTPPKDGRIRDDNSLSLAFVELLVLAFVQILLFGICAP